MTNPTEVNISEFYYNTEELNLKFSQVAELVRRLSSNVKGMGTTDELTILYRFESCPDYKVERTVSPRMETTIGRAYVILYFKTPRLTKMSDRYGV